ncbi:MAG TPA: hypothetical protein VL442_11650 [Mucilaginibacter sp.]|jgi:hypothetical protein|nr:hypothetical protein [Mucilaginibacter sp.]
MKIVKTLLVVLVAALSFGNANAQVRIKARIGDPPPRRVVVVHHPVRHHYYHHRHVVVRHRY